MRKQASTSTDPRSAFTLIELLTVIAIVAILAAIVIPAVGNVRKKASATKAVNSVRQIGIANMLYSQEHRGEIIGQKDGDYMGPMFDIARYIAAEDNLTWDEQISALNQAIDPNVPDNLVNAAGLPFTWSFNSIFNASYGRSVEGKAPWTSPSEWTSNARRMAEFEYPADTIYAISGNYQFNTNKAGNQGLLSTPSTRQSIFYLHGNNDSTPAVFLDGHAEMLSYPIDPKRINPSAR